MRSSTLSLVSILAVGAAKDAPTLLGRPGSNETTGWCHPGFARNVDVDAAFFETTGEHKSSCIACPAGTHSQGGVSSTCTTMADDWTTCSHLACKLVDSDTHCNFHSSSNPKVDLSEAPHTVATVASSCHDTADAGVQRISIFHHGSEKNGMAHKCSKNTGGVNGARGACECKCKRGFDYLSTPTETIETTMSVGGFTEATFTDHAQFAVQTAIAADLGVDVTHVTISNIQYSTDGGVTWFDVSVASDGRRLTEGQKKIRFDVNVKVTDEQKSVVEVKVNAIAAEPTAQATLVQRIAEVMVTEHISTEGLELSVACEEVVTCEDDQVLLDGTCVSVAGHHGNQKCPFSSDRLFRSSGKTVDTCRDQCEATADCAIFSFGEATSSAAGVCMGCAEGTSLESHDGFTAYLMDAYNGEGKKCPFENPTRLFRSTDLTLEGCYQQCLNTADCAHFSFGHDSSHSAVAAGLSDTSVCMGCVAGAPLEDHAGFTAYSTI